MDLCRCSAARKALRSKPCLGKPTQVFEFFSFHARPAPPLLAVRNVCVVHRFACNFHEFRWVKSGRTAPGTVCMGNRYGTLYFFKIPSNGIPSLVFRFPLNGRDIRFPLNEIFSPFFFFVCSCIYIESSRSQTFDVEFWICRSCWMARRRGIQRFIAVVW